MASKIDIDRTPVAIENGGAHHGFASVLRSRTLVNAAFGIAIAVFASTWYLRRAEADFGTCVPQFGAAGIDAWKGEGPGHPEWSFDTTGPDGHPHGAHIADPGSLRYDAALVSSAFVVPKQVAWIEFSQRRAYSWANTVAVLEIAIEGNDFIDITDAGGKFLSGGYDGRSLQGNPLGSRAAWSASPDDETITRVALPPTLDGKPIRLRFRVGSAGTGDLLQGWSIGGIHCSGK